VGVSRTVYGLATLKEEELQGTVQQYGRFMQPERELFGYDQILSKRV
jgi:hypothetical protein